MGGVVATSYLAGKASYKAAQVIEKDENSAGISDDRKQRFKERTKLVWKLYIPPVASGVVTIVCIVASQKTAGRRTTAAVAAYSITEKAFSEYKEKVIEQIGVGKEQKIRDQVAEDGVRKNPPNSREVIITGRGNVLFQEAFTGRYLRTDMESMRKAVNDFNYILNNDVWQALGEFYEIIGLDQTSISSEIGWNVDKLLDLHFSAVVDQGAGEPCIVFTYTPSPKPLYD